MCLGECNLHHQANGHHLHTILDLFFWGRKTTDHFQRLWRHNWMGGTNGSTKSSYGIHVWEKEKETQLYGSNGSSSHIKTICKIWFYEWITQHLCRLSCQWQSTVSEAQMSWKVKLALRWTWRKENASSLIPYQWIQLPDQFRVQYKAWQLLYIALHRKCKFKKRNWQPSILRSTGPIWDCVHIWETFFPNKAALALSVQFFISALQSVSPHALSPHTHTHRHHTLIQLRSSIRAEPQPVIRAGT